MNFFKELAPLAEGMNLTMRINVKGGQYTITVLPDEVNTIIPILAVGTAEELDEGFITSITRPLTETKQMLANSADYIASLQEALKNKEAVAKKTQPSKSSPVKAKKDDEEPEEEEDGEQEPKPKAEKKPATPAKKEIIKEESGLKQLSIL